MNNFNMMDIGQLHIQKQVYTELKTKLEGIRDNPIPLLDHTELKFIFRYSRSDGMFVNVIDDSAENLRFNMSASLEDATVFDLESAKLFLEKTENYGLKFISNSYNNTVNQIMYYNCRKISELDKILTEIDSYYHLLEKASGHIVIKS